MKKVFTNFIKTSAVVGLGLMSTLSYAQLEEGDVIIDLNYGIPSKGVIFATIDGNSLYNDIETSYIGPAGLRLQYMVASNFGIGIEGNYTKRTAKYSETITETEYVYNEDDFTYDYITTSTDYNVELSQTVIRAMFRTSWEFVNEEKLSVNWANSIGYRKASWKLTPNDYDNTWTFGTWPLAFRTAIGMRYWIADNVGINAEIGFSGGSYMNAGLSAKF